MKKTKSRLALLLIILIAFTSLLSVVGTTSALVGDFNGSGTLSTADAVYLLYHTLFGGEEYPIFQDGDTNTDGRIDSADATHLLYNILFGSDDYPLPYVNVTLNNNGAVNTYEMMPGSNINPLKTLYCDDLTAFDFEGWYDSDFDEAYTTVPDSDITLYAKYDGYNAYAFDKGGYYDPNNMGLISAVDDPFGGKGKVLYTPIIFKNDTVTYGYYRALAPSIYDGVSTAGFEFKKGHKYKVSFYYRFADNDPVGAYCKLDLYAVDPEGIQKDGSKQIVNNSIKLENGLGWKYFEAEVTNTTDYKHLYMRFNGGSTSVVYNFYLDDLVIKDVTPAESEGVKLIDGGVTQIADLKVGDTLPVIETYNDEICSKSFEFDGWYDETLTNKYTTVDADVDTYYAKYDRLTKLSFETGGMYDPNNKYSATSSGIAGWYREWDPVNKSNICLRADLRSNLDNTHVAFSKLEGLDKGYELIADNKYAISFNYYVETSSEEDVFVTVRSAAKANIGDYGGKSNGFSSCKLQNKNKWSTTTIYFTADEQVSDYPYLLLLAQNNNKIPDLKLYFDNFIIREIDPEEDVQIYVYTEEVLLNDNGRVTVSDRNYIGAELPETNNYYGAISYGWYNESLNAKYTCVPAREITMYSKYNGSIYNFENGGYYDPNGNFGTENSKFEIVADPTGADNSVLVTDLKGDVGNKHLALNASGYDNTDGYKLTVGNTYEISFMYYAENLNENGVGVQFRGCKKANIGNLGGKSSTSYGDLRLNVEGSWTGVTTRFTYNGTDLADDAYPYLLMMVQDAAQAAGKEACTATVYFDDIVIKETQPAKSYNVNDVVLGEWTLGWSGRPLNIVIPSTNFSYLAMMQCEELVDVIKGITTTSAVANIVAEDEWVQEDNQANIFIGDVVGHTRDNEYKINTRDFGKDDFAYAIGCGNVYIDGGSTYALAMGISEFAKDIESASSGYRYAVGTKVTGVYSDKIDDYSSASYYRPVFLEEFDQAEIDTTLWNVSNFVESNARDIVDENGNIIYDGIVDDPKKTPDEGVGHNWVRARSAKDTYLKDGKLIINGRYSKEHEMFYGGWLSTRKQMKFHYGYAEISCITAHGNSLWSALWMEPTENNTGLFKPEIDVNECFGNARYTAFNMHTWPTTTGGNLGFEHYSLDGRYSNQKRADAGVGKTFNDGFHTFGCLWTADGCKFTVDGAVYYEYSFDPSSEYYNADIDAFHEELSLIVAMTVGKDAAGDDPILGADYWNTSNQFIVDYVHVYQIDGQNISYSLRDAVEIDRTDLGEK